MQRYVRGRKLSFGGSAGFWESSLDKSNGKQIFEIVPGPAVPPPQARYKNVDLETFSASFAIVESRPLLRDCISMYLSTLYDATIDGFDTVEEMLSSNQIDRHDLVVMGWNGSSRHLMLGQLSKLCRECGHCPVIVMQDTCDYSMVSDVLRVGARGVIPTNLSSDVASEAIGLVMAGGSYIPAEGLMQMQPQTLGKAAGLCNLTAREEQVLALLKAGKQNKQIAYSLGLSEGTVKVHLHNLMKKLGTSNRTQTILAVTQ